MELILLAIKAIASNPWRSISLCVAIVCLGLITTIGIYRLRLREANISLAEEKAKLNKIVVDSIVLERNMAITTSALVKEKDKQVAEAKRLAKLLKDFPKDCEGAAQRAADILRERNK